MHNLSAPADCEAPLPWGQLSEFTKVCVNSGLTADAIVRMAYLLLDTAAEMRRAGIVGEMARA